MFIKLKKVPLLQENWAKNVLVPIEIPDLFFFKILIDFSNSHFVKNVKIKVNDKYIFHTLTLFQN